MQPQPRAGIPAFSLLQDANFRTIFGAGLLTETSHRIELLVLSWFILTETNSVFQLGLIVVFLNLPRPVLALVTGIMADRFSRHHILVVAQGINLLTAAAILPLIMVDLFQPWHVFAATFIQGIARALDHPSRRMAIFDVVGQKRLVNAMSLETIKNTLGTMIGPILGGVLLSLTGFGGAFTCVVVVASAGVALVFPVEDSELQEGYTSRSCVE